MLYNIHNYAVLWQYIKNKHLFPSLTINKFSYVLQGLGGKEQQTPSNVSSVLLLELLTSQTHVRNNGTNSSPLKDTDACSFNITMPHSTFHGKGSLLQTQVNSFGSWY